MKTWLLIQWGWHRYQACRYHELSKTEPTMCRAYNNTKEAYHMKKFRELDKKLDE